MKEAIERTFEPPEVHHERLFVISVMGFIVNLVGIFVFQHGGQGHHHGHGGCSHSHSQSHKHSHDQKDHNSHGYNDHYASPVIHNHHNSKQQGGIVALDMNGYSVQTETNNHHSHSHNSHQSPVENHNHSHQHDSFHEPLIETIRPKSSGRGQIMQSVFLHIVADTLGSVGVMISAVLMNQFGWMIADPLCSLFIAILISISVYPLLRDAFYVLMQRVPVEIEDKVGPCLNRVQGLEGVLSVHESHFWSLNSDTYIGCIKLEVRQNANQKYIMNTAKALLNQMGVDKVHIQIDQV